MRIAIIGGTGTLGRPLVSELRARGNEVRVLSRHAEQFPVDLATGQGLAAAFEGCDVVVDASSSKSPKKARAIFVEGADALFAAERSAGVRHHVCVSIVRCDEAPLAYYKVKVEQEKKVAANPIPWTIVRASQFHDFVTDFFEKGAKYGILPVLPAPLQTVAVTDVARVVADQAEAEPRLGCFEIAGPQVHPMSELAQQWKQATGSRAFAVRVPFPGAAGKAARGGVFTATNPDVLGRLTFADWLAERRSAQ